MACGLGSLPSVAAPLEDEMRDLIANHPQIQAKTKAVNSAEEGIRAARAGFLPTAKIGGDQGHEYVDSPDRRDTQAKPFSDHRNTASLTVTQKIFDGFATDSAVDAAKVSHDISDSDLRATRQTTLLEGTVAYLDTLRYTRLVALARESERKVSEQLNLEDERVQKGSGIASDVLAAKQRLQTAKARRVEYEGGFQAATARFTQVFGHAPEVAALSDPPLPVDLVPESLDASIDAAERDNPSLQSATKGINLSGERRRAAEAGYWPTVDLVGKADYEHGKNAVVGVRRDWSVLLVANWELFSGFKTDAQVAQASWDLGAAKDTRNQTSRKVSEAVRTAWYKLETQRQRLDLLDTASTLAEEVWEAQKKKQTAGKATITEVLDDENRIIDARVAYTGAFYDMYQAAFELLSALGRLEVESLARAKPAVSRDVSPDIHLPSKAKATASRRDAAPAQQHPPVQPVSAAVAPVTPPVNDQAQAAMVEHMRGLAAKDDFWIAPQTR